MILPYFIIIPLFAAFLITLVSTKKDSFAVITSSIAVTILFFLSIYGFILSSDQALIYKMSNWDFPIGIILVMDALTASMLIMVGIVTLTSLIYSIQYIRKIDVSSRYYALFMLLVAGMNGVILTGDLFNLFVFMEVTLLAAFALVAYGGKAEEYEAAFKYAVMGTMSSVIVLIGIAVTYSATSALTLAVIAAELGNADTAIKFWIGGLFLVGFGLKAAIIPFHAWLPDAHSSAPAPISSMLSGVVIKALGIYVLIRIFFNVLGAPEVFMKAFLILGAISILVGVFLAIGQWDFKRLLAYHSISQVGYILLGIGLATPLGILGAIFHLFNHALFKGLLFLNAGSVEYAIETRNLQKMGNLTKLLPVTSQTSMVASLSISGIPPFNGFFSKLIIIIACVEAGLPLYALFAVIGSLLTLASFMKVQRYGFRGNDILELIKNKISFGMNTAMIALAVLCLLTSVLVIPGIKEVTLDPIVNVILSNESYIKIVAGM